MILYRGRLLVDDNILRGIDHCTDRLQLLADAGQPFRIGITGNPKERIAEYGHPYSGMEVLWCTQSEEDVRKAETVLVELFQGYCENEAAGGAGDVKGPPYYLYVVH